LESRTLKSDFDTIGIDYSAFLKLFAKLLDAAVIFISLERLLRSFMALPHYQKKNKSASIIMHLVELDERFWY